MTDELKEAIQKSGNNLHFKVLNVLQKSGWLADISCYYLDDATGKPREIDIIAKQKIILSQFVWSNHPRDFWVYLFIECKHFDDEIALWMQNSSHKKELVKSTLESPDKLVHPQHHYHATDSLGKLYTTAGKESDIFDAIIQPIKALVSFRQRESVRALYYPICIYEGVSGFDVIKNIEDLKNLDKLERTENALVEVNYSWRVIDNRPFPMPQQEYFAVDLCHIENLNKLMERIYAEAEFARGKICNLIHEEESEKNTPEHGN